MWWCNLCVYILFQWLSGRPRDLRGYSFEFVFMAKFVPCREHLAQGKGPLNVFAWESKWMNSTNVLRLKVDLMKTLAAFRSEVPWKTTMIFSPAAFPRICAFKKRVSRDVSMSQWGGWLPSVGSSTQCSIAAAYSFSGDANPCPYPLAV